MLLFFHKNVKQDSCHVLDSRLAQDLLDIFLVILYNEGVLLPSERRFFE